MKFRILKNIWFLAFLIGIIGGFCAVFYYFLMNASLHLFWAKLHGSSWRAVLNGGAFDTSILFVTLLGGLLVGLSNKFLGTPGEIAAVIDNINIKFGRLRIKETPSMIVNSLVSIGAGGSAGPEAPLVQIIGSISSYFGDKLAISDDNVRICTFCGMACALGAFFGAPLGGALFALEIPHRKSVEYGEAIFPALISSTIGFLIYRSFVGYKGPIFEIASIESFPLKYFLYAVFLAFIGSIAGSFFIYFFRLLKKLVQPFSGYPLIMGCLGGLIIGVIALFAPETLFWGEWQVVDLLTDGLLDMSIFHLLFIAFAKVVAIAVTLHFGFRGGFIFPLFFIGATLGIVVSQLFPFIPLPLAVLSLMAAINISVTKTPLATVVILTSLSGTNLLPYLVVVGVVTLIFTNKITFIQTQQERIFNNPS